MLCHIADFIFESCDPVDSDGRHSLEGMTLWRTPTFQRRTLQRIVGRREAAFTGGPSGFTFL